MLLKRPILLLVVVTTIVYFSSLFNQFVWDDEQFIYRNQFVQTFDVGQIFTTNTIAGAGEISNYYRPLTTFSFAIDYQFWQLNPFGYHLVNTLLHAFAGVLLYLLLKRIGFTKNISVCIALIFLLHPLQTEAVTYANSRGDSLFSFWLLISLYLHSLLYTFTVKKIALYNITVPINRSLVVGLSVVAYCASLLSKEIALAGLGLHGLLLLRYFLLEYNEKKYFFHELLRFCKKNVYSLLTFVLNTLIVGSYLFLRATVLNFDNSFNFYSDNSLYSESLLVRLLTFSKIIFIYIRLLFIPYPLHMERDTSLVTSALSFWPLAFVVLIALLAYVCFIEWKRKRTTIILFGWAWFSIMIIPVTGIIAINGLLYEHWLYLPVVGFAIMVYGLVRLFSSNVSTNNFLKKLAIAVIFIYSILVVRQNYFWSTPVRLYTHLLKYTDSARIHNNLAMAYSEEKNYQEAIKQYQLALEFGQPYPQIYHNLANTYRDTNQLDQAEQNYKKALEISPTFFHSYISLIDIYLKQQRYSDALDIIHLAQSSFPSVFEYQLIELDILSVANDQDGFATKKSELLKQYSDDTDKIKLIQASRIPQR